MELVKAKAYTKHGCDIQGNLIVVDYYPEMKKDPSFGKFGSMKVYDYIDRAKELVQEKFGDFEVILSMPDLVCRLKGGK